MTPMEAWHIISANMLDLYKRRKSASYKGYTEGDIEAEVICFKALREAEKGLVRCSECKHCAKMYHVNGEHTLHCKHAYGLPEISNNDYCSRGEKKVEE